MAEGIHLGIQESSCCRVRISALALLKMAMHAKSGGNLEIMGMLQGKIVGNVFMVLDAFALPVEGTETRVNAQSEAYEFMIDFFESNKVASLNRMPPSLLIFLIAHTEISSS